MSKRNLFQELKNGIKEIKAHNEGKITLRTYRLEKNPLPKVDTFFSELISSYPYHV